MKPLDRNISILEHIVSYCDQIEETVKRFGNDYDLFANDAIYRNAAALCILQIGELVGKLSDDFPRPILVSHGARSKLCVISSLIATAQLTLRSPGKL